MAISEGGFGGGEFGSLPTGGGAGGRGSGCLGIVIVVLITLAIAALIVWALRDIPVGSDRRSAVGSAAEHITLHAPVSAPAT